jgi:cyclophilin family peptidyl-prolyl cis-trans isomerase
MSFEQDRSRGGEWFVPRLEGLEDRTTPSGNVTVINGGGILYVAGDNAGNHLQITATGSSSVEIRALDATTTINGQHGPLSVGGVRGEYINLYGGNDVLVIAGTRGDAALHVDLGSGNDTFLLNDARHRGETVILGGDGNDNIILGNSTFRHYAFINTGAGDDQVTALQYNGVDLGMLNPSGSDYFVNLRSTFVRPVIIGFGFGARPDTTAPTVTVNPLTTNDTTPQLTGTVNDPVSFVQVKVGTQTINASVSGHTWTATVPTALTAGTYTVTATATDLAGNTSQPATGTLVIDTTAPATPSLNLESASDTGTAGDLRTDLGTVTLVGTADAGTTVSLYSVTAPGTPGTGTPLATTTATSGGTFTFENVALAVGANSFAVKSSDAAGNAALFAQTFTRNTPPTVVAPIGAQTLSAAGSPATFDLTNTFHDAEEIVRFSTTDPVGGAGTIDVNLFPDKAPQTVANFLAHINSSNPSTNYDDSIFHRLAPGFVLQGGGFKFDNTAKTFQTIDPTAAQVPNEPGVSNTVGTIAMAKQGTNTTSVGTEFFFNLADNSSNLDNQNSGFTVFGQVMNGGQQTINKIATMSTYSGSGIPGAAPFPVSATANTTNFPANITTGDLAVVNSAVELTQAQKMAFSVAGNTDSGVATASVTGTTLTITPVAAGTTTITVQATDLDGSTTTTQIVVTVQ